MSQLEGRKLYYVRNVFLLSDGTNLYEIDEPIKWDEIDIQITWDESTRGYKFEFSDKDVMLEFDEAAGYSIINAEYEDKFESMNLSLHFGELDSNDVLTILFEAKLNFDSFHRGKYTIKMNCERRSFSDKFRTRFDTKTDLYAERSIEGLLLTELPMKELFLHPRILSKVGDFKYNTNVDPINIPLTDEIDDGAGDDPHWKTTVPPFKSSASNIDDLQEPTAPQGLLIYAGTSLPIGVSKRSFRFNCGTRYKFDMGNSSQFLVTGLSIYKRSNISGGNTDLFPPVVASEDALVYSDEIGNVAHTEHQTAILSGVLDLFADEAIFIKIWIWTPDNALFNISNFDYTSIIDHYLEINEETVYPGSKIDAVQIHEAVNRQLEIILDTTNPLKSDFLGRIDLGYTAKGCAADHLVIDGLGVRAMPDRPFNMSAKDWVNSLSNLFCMGLSVERDDDNNEHIRFEPLEYFFRDVLLYSFTIISKYEKRPALDYIFNELEFGFKKYPQDNQQDSIEDWMTRMEYITQIRTVKNKMSKIIDFIMSGYYLEYTRREAFADNPSNAYETDKDIFLISATDGKTYNGKAITFVQADAQIIIFDIVALIPGDTFTISNATGGVTNGLYTVVDAEIPFLYNRTIITVSEVLASDGAGIGDVSLTDDIMKAKRNEDFSDILGIPFEDSVYNLEHHISRIMIRWAKVFNAGLFKGFKDFPDGVREGVMFVGGVNNTNAYTTLKDSVTCRYGSVDEGYADWGDYFATLNLQLPLFKANIITFEAPLTWGILNDLRKAFEGRHPEDKDYGYFEWPNLDGVTEKGFILDLKFKPTTQMIRATFIEKYDA